MRLGISTSSFFNRVPTEAAFELLRQMRVGISEVFLNTFSEYEKPFADALALRRGPIAVHSIHALSTQFEPELFSTNARARADAESIFKKVCYTGYALGARFYTFHGPTKIKKGNYNFDYPKLAERINQLSTIAMSYGLRISYENVHWTYFDDPDYFRNLMMYCPNLFCTLDIKQAILSGTDPMKFLTAMSDRLSTIHLCDVDKAGETCMPGQGTFNFEKFFRELHKRNINAIQILEVYSKDYRELNEVKACYDTLEQLIQKIKAGG